MGESTRLCPPEPARLPGKMLEYTHFEGEPPDADLVYSIRRLATREFSIVQVLDLICSRFGQHEFPVATYLWLAFDVPIPLLKEFVAEWSQSPSPNALSQSDVSSRILIEIERTKASWEDKLQP